MPKPESSCCSIWTSPNEAARREHPQFTQERLYDAIVEGAARRLPRKFMTFATMRIGLIPILCPTEPVRKS